MKEELYEKQREWAEKSLFLMRDMLPLMEPVARYQEWTKKEQYTIGILISAAARSAESAFLLIAYGQLWDAEMPLRSAFEATLKFSYLLQSKDSFKERFKEYSHILFEISLLKDDKKIKDFLSVVSNPDADEWLPFRERLISQEEVDRMNKQYDKTYKRSLETRWGFTGLVSFLSTSNDPLFKGFNALTHGYSIASHIMHADYIGVSIPMERDERDDERRDLIHFAHLNRLISDAFTWMRVRAYVGYRFVGADYSVIEEAFKRIDFHLDSMKSMYDEWIEIEYGRN